MPGAALLPAAGLGLLVLGEPGWEGETRAVLPPRTVDRDSGPLQSWEAELQALWDCPSRVVSQQKKVSPWGWLVGLSLLSWAHIVPASGDLLQDPYTACRLRPTPPPALGGLCSPPWPWSARSAARFPSWRGGRLGGPQWWLLGPAGPFPGQRPRDPLISPLVSGPALPRGSWNPAQPLDAVLQIPQVTSSAILVLG